MVGVSQSQDPLGYRSVHRTKRWVADSVRLSVTSEGNIRAKAPCGEARELTVEEVEKLIIRLQEKVVIARMAQRETIFPDIGDLATS